MLRCAVRSRRCRTSRMRNSGPSPPDAPAACYKEGMVPAPVPDLSVLLALLPEDCVGVVECVEPISVGLSGAGVYAVTTSRGKFVLRVQGRQTALRVQGRQTAESSFALQLRVLQRAAAAGVAPDVLHVDEGARAVVSVRVPGVPMAAALAEPAQRGQNGGRFCSQRNELLTDRRKATFCELLAPVRALASLIPRRRRAWSPCDARRARGRGTEGRSDARLWPAEPGSDCHRSPRTSGPRPGALRSPYLRGLEAPDQA